MGPAIAEFKWSGIAAADVDAIVAAAGVAHGTFFFHFPTKEHVLLELERREEDRIANQINRFVESQPDLPSTLKEAVRLVVGLERRLGDVLFRTNGESSPCPNITASDSANSSASTTNGLHAKPPLNMARRIRDDNV